MSTLDRRTLLKGAAAVALAPVAAAIPAAQASAPALAPAVTTKLAWIVGTPGEYDWQHIIARTAEEAFAAWSEENDWLLEEDEDGNPIPAPFDAEFVKRVPEWDGLRGSEVSPADWLRAGYGHCCERCSYETHPNTGGRATGSEVVCEECLSFEDLWAVEREDTLDDLVNRVFADGETDAQGWLQRQEASAEIKAEAWGAALQAAREHLAATGEAR